MKKKMTGILLCFVCVPAGAADWPLHRGDAARSGYTAEPLELPLEPLWTYRSRHAPRPAWPSSDRLTFDRAFAIVVAGDSLYFGSSADCKVYCLDAGTGQARWEFFTAAPVRFAPAAWKDRVFAASDDGYLYCLAAAGGKLLWKRRGGPGEDWLLGNDRMVSRWPARGGPVVAGDRVYFAAGVWPSDGIFIHALSAATGRVVWTNGTAGGLVLDQPHGGARARSGVSAQGHLVVAGDRLLVPTGRAVPASFDRASGTFQYFHLQKYGQEGGSVTAAVGTHFYNSGALFDLSTGERRIRPRAERLARSSSGIVFARGNRVVAASWVEEERTDRRGKPFLAPALREENAIEVEGAVTALVVAGDRAICGGENRIQVLQLDRSTAVNSEIRETVGTVYDLAVAGGRVYASTDRGVIHCFDSRARGPVREVLPDPVASPYPARGPWGSVAEEILRESGVKEGFCLDLGPGDGALAYELARRSRLEIYAIDRDAGAVDRARRRLDAAGLYGVQVTVHVGDPEATPYQKYFANLVVSGRSAREGADDFPMTEARRLVRPYGGIVCVGKPGALARERRGALEGAGSWTHQYSDPANTGCSSDVLVRGPLGTLWYRDADLAMPQRHGRGPAPLFLEGRLMVEGLHALRGVDAYNGRTLWEFPLEGILADYDQDHLMGSAGTGSNFCADGDSVFLHRRDRCVRIDAATGRKLNEYPTPAGADGEPGTWGYIAAADDTLFGSVADTDHLVRWRFREADMSGQFTESRSLFALDPDSGERRWIYRAEHSIRHNAIAIGDGRVHVIDRPLAEVDRLERRDRADAKTGHPTGTLLALDAGTGRVIWRVGEEIYGTMLSLSVEHGVLLMGYQPTRFRLPSEIGGRLAAFHVADGYRLWEREAKYDSRPLINDATVYAQGGAWDLKSGSDRPFDFRRSYGCGILAGSRHLMLFRSATLGYYDLGGAKTTENFGGVRLGCWINALPVGGIVLVPDAASGCRCSYLNLASLALQTME